MQSFQPVFPDDSGPVGIYVHVPFCVSRCMYCAFVTNPYDVDVARKYVEALLAEVRLRSEQGICGGIGSETTFDTLYFGGGTPSLLNPGHIERIIHEVKCALRICGDAEITLEMNPATVTAALLRDLRYCGINRISLGVQSLNDDELRLMARPHTAIEALSTFRAVREAGFDNVSVDLIAGFPGQSRRSVQENLERVLALEPEHISVYLLELKHGTRLESQVQRKCLSAVNDDLEADMYEDICRLTKAAGFEHYEISNFAATGRRSRHNLKYWQDGIYFGFGAGAHGMCARERYANLDDLEGYACAVNGGKLPIATLERLTPESRLKDALIMGLRLVEGVDLHVVGKRYGTDLCEFVDRTVGDLQEAGLLRLDGPVLALTERGRLLSNLVFSRWV